MPVTSLITCWASHDPLRPITRWSAEPKCAAARQSRSASHPPKSCSYSAAAMIAASPADE